MNTEQFLDNINRGEPDACWVWKAARSEAGGYGVLRWNARKEYAHRLAYEMRNGPVPPGLFVLHKCDNPPCCNPNHLFAGTAKVNTDDARTKGRLRGNPAKGREHAQAILNDDQVRAIRERYTVAKKKRGLQSQLGREFGVTQSAIWRIVNNKNWVHLEDT